MLRVPRAHLSLSFFLPSAPPWTEELSIFKGNEYDSEAGGRPEWEKRTKSSTLPSARPHPLPA